MRIFYVLIWLCVFSINQLGAAESDKKDNIYWGDAKKPIAGALAAKLLSTYPKKIKDLHGNKKIDVYSIDLDTDGKNDFIIRERDAFKTCFAKSDFSIISCENLGYGDGFRYYWFVNIDSDPMLELISLIGDDDYSDYNIYKFDRKTWKMNKRIKIAPVIFSKAKNYRGIYWGYPWDITKLITSRTSGTIRIFSCISDLKNNDEGDVRNILFVAFEGIPTQGDPVGHFNYLEKKFKFMNLDYLKLTYEKVSD